MPGHWEGNSPKGEPDFSGLDEVLRDCGRMVVDDIVERIDGERRPDGSPQKQNSEGYLLRKIAAKGYTTPLKGIEKKSPVLAKKSTYKVDVIEDDEVMISIKPVRSAVAVYLHDMGYIFFGVSKEALDRIGLRIYGYVKRQVEAWFRG